jgi:hypothetical protein
MNTKKHKSLFERVLDNEFIGDRFKKIGSISPLSWSQSRGSLITSGAADYIGVWVLFSCQGSSEKSFYRGFSPYSREK